MEHLPPVGWADVATKRDLDHLHTGIRLEIAEARGDFAHGLRNQALSIVGANAAVVGAVLGITRLIS